MPLGILASVNQVEFHNRASDRKRRSRRWGSTVWASRSRVASHQNWSPMNLARLPLKASPRRKVSDVDPGCGLDFTAEIRVLETGPICGSGSLCSDDQVFWCSQFHCRCSSLSTDWNTAFFGQQFGVTKQRILHAVTAQPENGELLSNFGCEESMRNLVSNR